MTSVIPNERSLSAIFIEITLYEMMSFVFGLLFPQGPNTADDLKQHMLGSCLQQSCFYTFCLALGCHSCSQSFHFRFVAVVVLVSISEKKNRTPRMRTHVSAKLRSFKTSGPTSIHQEDKHSRTVVGLKTALRKLPITSER